MVYLQAFRRINYHNKRYKDQKLYGEGEITSHSTSAVIELYRKHFEGNQYLPLTTSPTTFLVLIGTTWNDIGKSIKLVNLKNL